MNHAKSFLIIIAVGLAAFLTGRVIHMLRASHTKAASAPSMEQLSGPQPSANPPEKSRSKKPSPLAAKLENDISMSNGVTRWLHWLEALELSRPEDFPSLWRMAEDNPELQDAFARRWSENYPRQFFDFLVALSREGRTPPWGSLDVLFAAWAKKDLKGLILALKDASNFPSRDSWRMHAVAGSIFDNDPEAGLRLMAEWNISNHIPRMNAIPDWAGANPSKAAEFALQNLAGAVTQSTLAAIAGEWAKKDPAAALEFAYSRAGQFRDGMAEAALEEWTKQNIQQAGAWLAKAPQDTRHDLAEKFVETWAKQDVNSAIQWAESNLTGAALARAVAGAARGLAAQDPAAAAALVKQMDPSVARTKSAAAVARQWFPDQFAQKLPSTEAIQWLGSLDPESMRRAFAEVTWSWSATDPNSMAEFMATSENELPEWTYSALARNLARKDPRRALDWTQRLPPKPARQAGEEAFGEWRRAQPGPALEWLNGLSAEDPRRNNYFEKAIQDWAGDAKNAEQLAQFASMNPAAARAIIQKLPMEPGRREKALATFSE